MDGALLIRRPDGAVVAVPLPREPGVAGSDAADDIRLHGPGVHPGHASFRWVANRATWELNADRESAPVRVNGRQLLPGSGALLSAGDEILLGGLHVRFRKIPAPPRMNNRECPTIDLNAGRVVLGRAIAGTAPPPPDRVELDPEDGGLSREHAVIESEGGRHWLEDRSRAGTELNGQGSFGRRPLVVGDRIRLRDYCFEYDGTALHQVDVASGASIDTERATVEVPSPDGPRAILRDVSVSIRSGEFVGILGGSGQGKTTLLQLLCGLIRPSSGEVRFNGVPTGDVGGRPAVGYVPQDDLVHGELTVREAIAAAAKLRLKATPDQLDALVQGTMERLGLQDHAGKRIGSEISGGQRKRVSIATELLTRPPVLLLDEPSSGLDPYAEEELMGFLQSLRNTGQTVLCTTHVLNRAYLFDRILFVHGGRLIFSGTPHEARLHFLEEDEETGSDTGQRAPLERIYREVQQSRRSAEEWEKRFLESPFAVRGRSQAPPAPVQRTGLENRRRNSPLDVVRILLRRQWRILAGDRMSPVFLAGQAVGIGLLIAWAAANPGLRMFLMLIATLWFGCSNAAQQIVNELPIYRRERVCGVGRHSFLAAKCAFFTAVTLMQTAVLWLCAGAAGWLIHGAVAEDAGMPLTARLLRVAALGLAAVTGTGMGLAVSALSRSATQAVLLVPLLMIPQVLLGGYVIARPEMSAGVRAFAALWPSWSVQRIADVSGTSGRYIPLMTGNTRIPIFLQIRKSAADASDPAVNRLSPEQEQVKVDRRAWPDGPPSADPLTFERISQYNVAWQNILVDPSRVGQHEDTGRATVAWRNDVRMSQRDWQPGKAREIHRDAGPAVTAFLILAGHCAAFYFVCARGLRVRERVRG